MSRSTFDVVIVGAGIVGSACALECVRAGLRVAVLESSCPGGGATAAGMGHILVLDDSPAQFALTSYSQRLWHELEAELPADCEFWRCGTVWVAVDEEEMEEVRRKQQAYGAPVGVPPLGGLSGATDRLKAELQPVPVEVLDGKELARAEPNLRPGLAGGLLVPGDTVIYPPCAVRFFLAQAQALGAVIRERTAVRRATFGSKTGREVRLSDGSSLSAGVVVNATGHWAAELTPGLEVRPKKGHLVITDRYPGFVRHQLMELGYLKSAHAVQTDSVAFVVQPRPSGQVLLGSSRQHDNSDPAVEPAILSRMLRRAEEFLPGLAQLLALRVWTGFRAATPDNLPLIGPTPTEGGPWLATGHEGLGITTSLATARLLVDQLLKRTPAIPWEPYLPSRVHP